ncbi:hypothetical protein NC796_01115 [Aliifodinibius sp. S!AR15-10]|uniref:hypothetical protein n=1 Tax=Aliifodinibius sp. S!AR15-10 TaxID=2950437 RepID=UPI00285F5CB2|nr:hypothetical protein [Aliifodinibius sp. S!AR15-10]MDR8389715.1 hypothetical protein [Aliifodinibius sp. S!AR15-10]
MKLSPELLKKLIQMIKMTRPDEIGCDECFDDLHAFAELELAGKSAEDAMPLVKDHLDRCGTCREEYEALLEAMKNLN